MSDGGLTPQEFADENTQAEDNGFTVQFADPETLLLDLDSPDAIQRYRRLLPKVNDLFGAAVLEEYESKSGPGHLHVVVCLGLAASPEFRIALQAALGSDPLRELLSLRRLLNGVVEPSRLFRKKT